MCEQLGSLSNISTYLGNLGFEESILHQLRMHSWSAGPGAAEASHLHVRFLKSCCKGSSACIRMFGEFPGSRQNVSLVLWWNKLYFVFHKLVPFLAHWEAVLTQVQGNHPSALPSEGRLRTCFRSSVCWGDRAGRDSTSCPSMSDLAFLSLW